MIEKQNYEKDYFAGVRIMNKYNHEILLSAAGNKEDRKDRFFYIYKDQKKMLAYDEFESRRYGSEIKRLQRAIPLLD